MDNNTKNANSKLVPGVGRVPFPEIGRAHV